MYPRSIKDRTICSSANSFTPGLKSDNFLLLAEKSPDFDIKSRFELKISIKITCIILIPKTARHPSHPTQDATKRLQAKIGVVCDGHPGKLDGSVQELPLEVGWGVMGAGNMVDFSSAFHATLQILSIVSRYALLFPL
jgi:hypothetical protein